uniref:Phospholipase A(2) n=1 Tax=Globodera pallida TaxID=36090 RepID=A0A183BQB9_GLOPA
MFGRALLLLFMINLPLSDGWFWEAPFKVIKNAVVGVADTVLDVVDLGTDLLEVPPIQLPFHTKWECGPDYPKKFNIPSHAATWASVMWFCRLWKDDVNACCIQHDKCCNHKSPPPCDKPFYMCLAIVAARWPPCAAPLATFIGVMMKYGGGDPTTTTSTTTTTTTTTTVTTTTTKEKQTTKPGFMCLVGGIWDGTEVKAMKCPHNEHYCYSIGCGQDGHGLFDKYGCCADGEDNVSQCQKLRGNHMSGSICVCSIGAKDANMSNELPPDIEIVLGRLSEKSAADVAERDG